MSQTNILVTIGVEQSDGSGAEKIGDFITNTDEYNNACDLACERATELSTQYPMQNNWYAYVADKQGHKKIF